MGSVQTVFHPAGPRSTVGMSSNDAFSRRWLMAGFLWFLLGIAWAPSSKLYQQGLVALLWLPAALCIWPARESLSPLWRHRRAGLIALVALFTWALISLLWSTAPEPGREAKRMLYPVLFMTGVVLLAGAEPRRLIRPLWVSGLGLALAAFVSIIMFYGVAGQPWMSRLAGIGQLEHPILGGYVMGVAALWLLCLLPEKRMQRVVSVVAVLALVAYMALTQSRGVWLALLATVALLPAWRSSRLNWTVSGSLLALAVLGFMLFEPIVTARGTSYRLEITQAALAMIGDNPLWGLGAGSGYEVAVPELKMKFDHSHNVFTHLGIELGLPGLLLWLVVWGGVGVSGWRNRRSALGETLLVMWIYATLALMFDGASLLDTPRPEWMLTWLPIALWLALMGDESDRRLQHLPLGDHETR